MELELELEQELEQEQQLCSCIGNPQAMCLLLNATLQHPIHKSETVQQFSIHRLQAVVFAARHRPATALESESAVGVGVGVEALFQMSFYARAFASCSTIKALWSIVNVMNYVTDV